MSLFTIRLEVPPIEIRITNDQSSGSGELKAMLGKIAESILNLKEITMTAAQDMQDKIDTLTGIAESANTTSDQLIVLVTDLRKQITDLGAAGGASVAELAAMGAQIDGVAASITQQAAENTAALGAVVVPPPAVI